MLRSLPKGLKAGGRLFVSTPYLPGYLVPSRRALTTVGLSLEERKLELEARKLDTEERRWNEEKSREERRWKEELEERREARKEEERRWNEEKSREERRWKEEERRWNRQKFTETIIQKGWVVLIGGLFYWLGPSIVSKLYGSCLAQVPNIQQLKTKIEEEMVEARMNDAGQRAIDCPPFEEKISNSQPKQIKELLNSDSHRVIILDGPRGSGKSWSLGKALHEIKTEHPLIYQIKLTGINSDKDLLLALCDGFGFRSLSDMTVSLNIGGASFATPDREFESLSLLLAKIDSYLAKRKNELPIPVISVDDLEAVSLKCESFDTFMRFCRNWAKDNKAKVVMASSNTHVSRMFATAADKIHYVGDLENKDIVEHLTTNHGLNQEEVGKVIDKIGRKAADIRKFSKNYGSTKNLEESIDKTVKSLSESAQLEYEKVRSNLALQDIVPVLSKITRYAGQEEKNGSSPLIQKFLAEEEKAFQELLRNQIIIHDSNGRVVFASKFLQEFFLKNLHNAEARKSGGGVSSDQ